MRERHPEDIPALPSGASTGLAGWKLFQQYMGAVGRALRMDTGYTERQCAACPYEHHCCTLPVWITPFEASAIFFYLNQLTGLKTTGWKAAIFKRAEEFREASKGKDGVDADHKWFAQGKHCVFYDKAQRKCSIYEARPMACRLLYSTANCKPLGHWNRVEFAPESTLVLMRRLIELMVVKPGSMLQDNCTEMSTMLERLLKNPGEVAMSTLGPDSYLGMLRRAGQGEVIPDEELLFGLPKAEIVSPLPA